MMRSACAARSFISALFPSFHRMAAQALRITAPDLLEFGVIDEVIPEPLGGAHIDHAAAAKSLQEALTNALDDLRRVKPDKLVRRRREKFLRMGMVTE